MKYQLSNITILHFTVLIWGFTAILGALISVNETHLVWYRLLIASLAIYGYFKYKKINYNISKQQLFKYFGTGAIVALHWILFFGSIKASTVSVAIVCLSCMTLFTAFLEPLLNGNKISLFELLAGFLIIIGIYLIFTFESKYSTGIIMGILSALCASIFAIMNGKFAKKSTPSIISFYELLGAFCWVSVYLLITKGFNKNMYLNTKDLVYLLFLGIVCTAFAYSAGVAVMRELSAFKVALVTNLEPLYSIILALIIFGESEKMTTGFYAGSMVILTTVFLFTTVKNRLKPN